MCVFMVSGLVSISRIIKATKPDGLICFFSLPVGPIGTYVSVRFGIPYVVSIRGGDLPGCEKKLKFLHAILKPIRRMVLSSSNAIVANSKDLAKNPRKLIRIE